MFGYPGEQAVLDRVPFGRAGRVVSDRGGDAKWVAQLSLDFSLPGPGTQPLLPPESASTRSLDAFPSRRDPARFHQVAME